MVRLGDIVRLERSPVDITADGVYSRIGIYSWGKGLMHRDPVTVPEIGKMRYFTFPRPSLIFSNIQAWEGAVALASSAEADFVCSSRFLPYVPTDTDEVSLPYLHEFFRSRQGLNIMRAASPGTQVRNKTLSRAALENSLIPLPSRPDQDRIVAHLDSIAEKASLASDAAAAAHQTLRVLREQVLGRLADVSTVPLGQVLTQVDQTEIVDPGMSYPMLGVRAWGRGAFASGVILGSGTKYPKLRRMQAGQVCYPKLMGWQGAFTIIPPDLGGYFVSPEFVAFAVATTRVGTNYLAHALGSAAFWQAAAAMASGTNANRRRLQPSDFLNLHIPLPDQVTQAAVSAALDTARRGAATADDAAKRAAALLPAARNEILAGLQLRQSLIDRHNRSTNDRSMRKT